MRNKSFPYSSSFYFIIIIITTICFIFKLFHSVTNLDFGSKYSQGYNRSIQFLNINKLNLQWKIGKLWDWVGVALNAQISSGIYRLFEN
jgi:hypothetical protein